MLPTVVAGEVRRDPGGDLLRGVAAARACIADAAADEVVDLAVAHQLLELRERRRRVAAVEAADRPSPGRRSRAGSRPRCWTPTVAATQVYEPASARSSVDQRGAGAAALQQAARPPPPGAADRQGPPAAAGCRSRRCRRCRRRVAGLGAAARQAAAAGPAAGRRRAAGSPQSAGPPSRRRTVGPAVGDRAGVRRSRRSARRRRRPGERGDQAPRPRRPAPPSRQPGRAPSSSTASATPPTSTTVRSHGCQVGGPGRAARDAHNDVTASVPARIERGHDVGPAPPEQCRRRCRRAPRSPAPGRPCSTRGRCPCMKLKTSPVTSSQPPHSSSAARVRSVRGARQVTTEPGHQQDQRRGQQPGDLAADLGAEHPRPARRAPACLPAAAADAAGLVAGQPAEAVVAERQLEDAVVLRAADVRPGDAGHERDDGDPPAGRRRAVRRRRRAALRCGGASVVGAATR